MEYECYLLAEHYGGHMEGRSGQEESGAVHLTVSTSRKGVAEKGKIQVPGPWEGGWIPKYPIKTHLKGLLGRT